MPVKDGLGGLRRFHSMGVRRARAMVDGDAVTDLLFGGGVVAAEGFVVGAVLGDEGGFVV